VLGLFKAGPKIGLAHQIDEVSLGGRDVGSG
jgi:hypothetical protein